MTAMPTGATPTSALPSSACAVSFTSLCASNASRELSFRALTYAVLPSGERTRRTGLQPAATRDTAAREGAVTASAASKTMIAPCPGYGGGGAARPRREDTAFSGLHTSGQFHAGSEISLVV